MRVTFWGTRGSIATPGPETVRYGGDTACVAVEGDDPEHLLILDAGTGVRRLGLAIPDRVRRIDLLLSHLHLDHIVGLGFFAPMFRPDVRIAIRAPAASSPLLERLGRYLSPPLFPVRLRDVACDLTLQVVADGPMALGPFRVTAEPVIHPDVALGYRIDDGRSVVAYIPDHEPALGPSFPFTPAWTSGAAVASGATLLVHDGQYAPDEYAEHVGWGHSSVVQAVAFADLVGAATLALFHHDPQRGDAEVDALTAEARAASRGTAVLAARQGATIDTGASPAP